MENQQVKLMKGAIPTLFPQFSKKKRALTMLKDISLDDVGDPDLGRAEDPAIINHNPSKSEEEVIHSEKYNSSRYTPLTGVNLESVKFMDDMVLIDGTYILEDNEPANNRGQTSNSLTICGRPRLEERVGTGDNCISSDTACYKSLEDTLVFQEEDTTIEGDVIIVESSSVDITCPEMVLIHKTPQSILVEQPSQETITGCKPLLNTSEIATPSTVTVSASPPSEYPPEEDFTTSETDAVIAPPPKRHKFSCEDLRTAGKEDEEEPFTLKESKVMDQLEPLLSVEKGVVSLPVSLKHHLFGKNTPSDAKWQDGTFMCRLCGIASNKTVNLFSSEANKIKLLERITSVLPIMIVQSDDLPQDVCSKCLSHLNSCSELIVTSFNTHKQLASVMGQDFNQSSQLSVYFHERKRKQHDNPDCNRQILIMEICHKESKPVEEYLSIALEDLYMRLHPKRNSHDEPQCNLVLASISNSCSVSEVEQVRTAAEALISKGVIQNERTDTTLHSPADEEDTENLFAVQDSNEVATETTCDKIKAIKCMSVVEPAVGCELEFTEVQAMPVTDDVSPSDYYSTGIRCPKFQRFWKKKETSLKHMQNFLLWNTVGGEVNLTCKICECVLDRHSDIDGHLKEHYGTSCNICLAIFHSQDECDAHKCEERSLQGLMQQPDESLSSKTGRFLPKYQCSFCIACLDSKPTLKQHMLQEHAGNTKCESCGYNASDVCEATLHRRKCSEFRKCKEWQCRKCLEIFSIEEELQKHLTISAHADVTTWLCDICGKSFSHSAKLHQHKKSHLPPEFKYIHQCPHCPKRYINSSRLKEHMQKHEEKKYMCKVCGKLFSTKQILRQHEFTHGDPQFLCSLCSRTFFRKSHLLKHMNVHNPENSRASRAGPQPHRDGLNRCRECKKVFEQKELLLHYKLTHPLVQLQNYICEICKEENTSYAELFQHQREVHKTGVKDCPFCEKTIDSSTQMKYHLMRHEGMFPYNCPMCNNGYTANSILQDHIRRKHTGEKPFECQQCSKRFPTNGALAQHSTVHSLPHQLLPCPVCNQGFKRKAHLDVHLRTHTGEKPYPCPICDRPFRQRPDCVKHVRVIHGEDPANYDIRFHPNMCVTFPQVVSVADMELVLEGEDLMQASLEASQLLASQ